MKILQITPYSIAVNFWKYIISKISINLVTQRKDGKSTYLELEWQRKAKNTFFKANVCKIPLLKTTIKET